MENNQGRGKNTGTHTTYTAALSEPLVGGVWWRDKKQLSASYPCKCET